MELSNVHQLLFKVTPQNVTVFFCDPPRYMSGSQVYPNSLRFDLGPTEIVELGSKIIADSRQVLDSISQVEDPAWDTIIKLSDEATTFASASSNCYFPSYVSSDKRCKYATGLLTDPAPETHLQRPTQNLRPTRLRSLSDTTFILLVSTLAARN